MDKKNLIKPNVITVDRVASAIWDKTIPELMANDTVTTLDEAILINYCFAYATALRNELYLHEYGSTHQVGKYNYVQARPEVALAREAWKEVRSCADRLGLSPMSRKKIQIGDGETDPFFE